MFDVILLFQKSLKKDLNIIQFSYDLE